MTDFIDYYDLLQISPNAEIATINRVYRMLASRYHPDTPGTGDTEKFLKLREAYEVLRDPERRADYDVAYQARREQALPEFLSPDFDAGTNVEANRRLGVLSLLYGRRRLDPDAPTMSMLDLEQKTGLPREHLVFAVWYLRGRGLAERDEDANLLITADGVDYLESHLPHNPIVMKLLKAHFSSEEDPVPHPMGPWE